MERWRSYFIRCDTRLAGFALIRRGSRITGATDVMDVAEFFVVRGERRSGVGTRAAHAVFGAFSEHRWEVRARAANIPALRFWEHAIASWVERVVESSPFTVDGVDWKVLRFGGAMPDGARRARGLRGCRRRMNVEMSES